jgi:hypothetical protein
MLVFQHTHSHKEKTMSKTPYEIRLELLKLAKDSLYEPVYQKRDSLREEFLSKLTEENRDSVSFPTMPDFPGTTDIIAEAEKLNKFVSQQ